MTLELFAVACSFVFLGIAVFVVFGLLVRLLLQPSRLLQDPVPPRLVLKSLSLPLVSCRLLPLKALEPLLLHLLIQVHILPRELLSILATPGIKLFFGLLALHWFIFLVGFWVLECCS